MSRWIVITVVVCGLAAGALAQAAAKVDPHEKLVKELYGKRIAAAQASADPADNISLARELTSAGAEAANPVQVRHILAMEAVNLTAPIGTPEAAKLARDALALADRVRRLGAVEKSRVEVTIARGCQRYARRTGAKGKALVDVIGEVVDAEIALARALMENKEFKEAEDVLQTASGAATRHELAVRAEQIRMLSKELRTLRTTLGRIRRAEARLKSARLISEEKAILGARRQLGSIHLLQAGDVVKASEHLAGTGDEHESVAAAAAKYLKAPAKLPPADQCNELVSNLCKVAKAAANDHARLRLGRLATDICRAFLATKPKGLAATKARLLLKQAETLAEDTPEHRLIRKLKASYGGLAGKLEVPRPGIVRASYDFAGAGQLGDWTVQEGAWRVLAGKNILAGGPPAGGKACIESRLRFRANKPLTFSFRASGEQDLNAALFFKTSSASGRGPVAVHFRFGASRNRRSHLSDDGWHRWWDSRLKVIRNRSYKIDIVWDGAGKVTWSIDGKQICEQKLRSSSRSPLAEAWLQAGLETEGKPAGFDDVTLEGDMIEGPSAPRARSP